MLVADLDGDGHEDLAFPQDLGPCAMYWGHGDGTFSEADPGPGFERPDKHDQLISAADYDGDGLLDVLLVGVSGLTLLHNQGDRTFEDVSAAVGLPPVVGYAGASVWADYDQDGDLDLFLGAGVVTEDQGDPADYPDVRDFLWRNDGGVFVDDTADLAAGGGTGGATLHVIWRDADNDGDPDLLKFNDAGPYVRPSQLMENGGPDGSGGWLWTDRKPETMGDLGFAMGAALLDMDGDGDEELWVTNIGPLQAFDGLGMWDWLDVTVTWGSAAPVGDGWTSWSVLPIDVDGYGEPGLFVTYSPLTVFEGDDDPDPFGRDPMEQPDRFLQALLDDTGITGFELREEELFPPAPPEKSHGAARADLNEDGVPDIVVGRMDVQPALWIGRCTQGRRLTVDLRDPHGLNLFAVGAAITVEADGRLERRYVQAGGEGSFSGGPPRAMFGVGDAETVERLTVRWPDGQQETFLDVCTHCAVRIERVLE